MSGPCLPKAQAIEETLSTSSTSEPKTSTILGHSIVTALNLVCLAFIAYHFLDHPPEPPAATVEPAMASAGMGTIAPLPARMAVEEERVPMGNIELVTAPKIILGIASHVEGVEGIPVERTEQMEAEMPKGEAHLAAVGPHDPKAVSNYWIQLGALSKEATARQYWLRLKVRHPALLRDREPRYFGPEDIGGSLHHIRIGPMAGDAAAGICEQLQSKGADCFRVKSSDQPS